MYILKSTQNINRVECMIVCVLDTKNKPLLLKSTNVFSIRVSVWCTNNILPHVNAMYIVHKHINTHIQ